MTGMLRRMMNALRRTWRVTALAIVALVSPMLVNCYGQFPLTKFVYNVNGNIEPGILQQVVFWVFVIIPVYGIAILADALVLNLIEFWTGGTVSVGSVTNSDGSTVVLQPSADGREQLMTVSRDGAVTAQVRFVRVSDTLCEVRDSNGKLAGTVVRTAAGDLNLTDAKGQVVSTITAQQLALLKARAKAVPTESL